MLVLRRLLWVTKKHVSLEGFSSTIMLTLQVRCMLVQSTRLSPDGFSNWFVVALAKKARVPWKGYDKGSLKSRRFGGPYSERATRLHDHSCKKALPVAAVAPAKKIKNVVFVRQMLRT